MKNFIISAVFGTTLLFIGACTQGTGTTQAHATEPQNPNYILTTMPSVNDYSVTRLVDCEALTVSYVKYDAISTVSSLNSTQIARLCPNV